MQSRNAVSSCARLAIVAMLASAPFGSAFGQNGGPQKDEPAANPARQDPQTSEGGRDGDSVGPASSSGETKGTRSVGAPNPLAGSTLGKR